MLHTCCYRAGLVIRSHKSLILSNTREVVLHFHVSSQSGAVKVFLSSATYLKTSRRSRSVDNYPRRSASGCDALFQSFESCLNETSGVTNSLLPETPRLPITYCREMQRGRAHLDSSTSMQCRGRAHLDNSTSMQCRGRAHLDSSTSMQYRGREALLMVLLSSSYKL